MYPAMYHNMHVQTTAKSASHIFYLQYINIKISEGCKTAKNAFGGGRVGGWTRGCISIVAIFISQIPVVLVAYFMIVFMPHSYFFVFVFHYVFRTMSDRTLKKFLKSCYIYCKYTARIPRAYILLT